MTDRLSAPQWDELAEAMAEAGHEYDRITRAFRRRGDEAARREAEGQPGAALDKLANGDEWNTDAPPPTAPDDLVQQLRDKCNGSPAKIEWPHRILHEAADAIEALRARAEAAEAKAAKWKALATSLVGLAEQARSYARNYDDFEIAADADKAITEYDALTGDSK